MEIFQLNQFHLLKLHKHLLQHIWITYLFLMPIMFFNIKTKFYKSNNEEMAWFGRLMMSLSTFQNYYSTSYIQQMYLSFYCVRHFYVKSGKKTPYFLQCAFRSYIINYLDLYLRRQLFYTLIEKYFPCYFTYHNHFFWKWFILK